MAFLDIVYLLDFSENQVVQGSPPTIAKVGKMMIFRLSPIFCRDISFNSQLLHDVSWALFQCHILAGALKGR